MIALHNLPFLNLFFKRGLKTKSLYFDKYKVIDELQRRRRLITDDTKLLRIIKPTDSIKPLLEQPHLVFFRQVATPLHETLEVIKLADSLKLKLCILEYGEDKLVSAHNFYKLGLGKLPVYKYTDKTGRDVYQNHTIIDFNTYAGKHLKDVYTLKGERLMDFHHDFLEAVIGSDKNKITIIDASDWFAQFNNHASEYYESFFTLFIKHNVLAEIFLLDRDTEETNFANLISSPAFDNVTQQQNYSPLIINYQPENEQTRIYWDCYPSLADDFLKKKGYIE